MVALSERLLDMQAFNVASVPDSLPVKKKQVEDQDGKCMRVLLPTKPNETPRRDKRLKLHVNLKR
jgi:hypothetical protein